MAVTRLLKENGFPMRRKRWTRRVLLGFSLMFIFMNVVAYIHAWKFTHFSSGGAKTKNPHHLSASEKLRALLFGINNPRPENQFKPLGNYKTIGLQSNKRIEGWLIPCDSARGTILIFHGYSGNKSSMLDKAVIFKDLGYETLLIDFMGSGGSEGNQTTIGFFESQEVCAAFRYSKQRSNKPVVLFGTSMGAAAIMKAVADSSLAADALILECPFGTMQETVEARFRSMHAPVFPMARLLVFWGGVQNGFNAFAHNPASYASKVNIPTLLMYGEKDRSVSRSETDRIFTALGGAKKLVLYPEAGHENYLNKYKALWTSQIEDFLDSLPSAN